MTRYRFEGLAGPGRALLRGRPVRKKGEAPSMFEMSAGFALELTADDMRAMAEEALALAARADEWTERSAKIKAYAKGLEAK